MEYHRLGLSGLKVSRIGLGMMGFGDPSDEPWYLSEELAEPIVRRAVESGVTLFDTADQYSAGVSEQITGRLLGKLFPRREDYVLATKVYYPMGDGPNDRGLSRKHIMSAVDASLRRLGTDHIDLYQIHRWDPQTPIEETMAALHDVVRSGKVRYLGASLMRTWQLAKAQYTARAAGLTTFVSMQTRYSLVYREEEREMLPFCVDQGVGVIPYSPLARGLLAGTRERGTAGVVSASQSVRGGAGVASASETVRGAAGVGSASQSVRGAAGVGSVPETVRGAAGMGSVPETVRGAAGVGSVAQTARAAAQQAGPSRVTDSDLEVLDAVRAIAAEHHVPPAQVALAWVLSNSAVSAPVIGATKVAQIDDAIAAATLTLDADDLARLEAPYQPHLPYGY